MFLLAVTSIHVRYRRSYSHFGVSSRDLPSRDHSTGDVRANGRSHSFFRYQLRDIALLVFSGDTTSERALLVGFVMVLVAGA
jgi:hypothetical protein